MIFFKSVVVNVGDSGHRRNGILRFVLLGDFLKLADNYGLDVAPAKPAIKNAQPRSRKGEKSRENTVLISISQTPFLL